MERQIRHAHVVKASAEDAGWLYPGEPARAVARRWQRLGPDLVVVTLGAGGAFGLSSSGAEASVPAVPAAVRDTIGAGNAFSAGLLDVMADEHLLGARGIAALASLDAALLGGLLASGALVAAMTCERSGADPPYRADVLRRRAGPPPEPL